MYTFDKIISISFSSSDVFLTQTFQSSEEVKELNEKSDFLKMRLLVHKKMSETSRICDFNEWKISKDNTDFYK